MIAAPAVEDAEAAEPLALEDPEPVVDEDPEVEEDSDALDVMVLEPLAEEVELPVAVVVGALVDEAVPEPAVAL